jgi:hypothetical protein
VAREKRCHDCQSIYLGGEKGSFKRMAKVSFVEMIFFFLMVLGFELRASHLVKIGFCFLD